MGDPAPLYFISCGPGDPDLLTLAGARALSGSRCVLAPALFKESFADLLEGKEVQSPFSMDRAALTGWIDERLSKGPVAFLVPGDFSIFCPFQSYVAQYGDRAKVIPGVGAFAAAAAVLGKSLDLPGVAHSTIITSPKAYRRDSHGDFAELAGQGRTLVLYMNDRPLEELVEKMTGPYAPDTPIAILERIGCDDQQVTVATLSTIVTAIGDRDPFGVGSDSREPTLALTIIGDSIGQDEAPKWWDHRYENIWKPRGVR